MGFLDIFRIKKIKQENEELKKINENLATQIKELGVTEYNETINKINQLENEYKEIIDLQNKELDELEHKFNTLNEDVNLLEEKHSKLTKSLNSQQNKLNKYKEIYKSIEYSLNNFFDLNIPYNNCLLNRKDIAEFDETSPSVILKLHCMDIKSLRKAYRDNENLINKLLEQYSSRYTTKANKSIYDLMVIALRAELQNVLYNLKYEKLDKSIEDIKSISAKYLKIAAEGNQSIASTLTKFIGEIEYLFINAIKIEYNYYVKKEQARQEQLAIKEQMKQEAEERKTLEAERKKIEKEESKFITQISNIEEQMKNAKDKELETLKMRILELQAQLSDVVIKKEEITSLQNGKAGHIYIISNLGSFGENIFKIGMTRRLDPQERINELSNASVPFKFDVHSFIFSDDASQLETELHKRLNEKRVNKVNLRKEFFNITLDELETLVYEICPTAEFTKTMLAEEFKQSLSATDVYSSNYELADENEED